MRKWLFFLVAGYLYRKYVESRAAPAGGTRFDASAGRKR